MMKQVNIRIPFRMLALLLGLFLSVGAFAQIDVKGHVKDAQGEPIIGATVRVAGTQIATITDFDGNFTLKAKQGADITVTYIGYQTATAKAAADMTITLADDATTLETVVVIGYGVARKTDLTGSVTAIKPDDKNHGMQVSMQDMLQGKIAGVNVNSASGAPGDGAQIRIRGGSSLNASNDPLIVIDGMQIDSKGIMGTNNPLALVNPNDIESFTVLKDASATAIYGSRGSNGVIIITTKKGRRNQSPKISYNGTFSVSNVSKKLDVMNADEYTEFIRSRYGENSAAYNGLGWKKKNEDGTPDYRFGTYDTDWQDEIFRAAFSHDHNVSVTGGVGGKNWAMPYRVSVGYTNQQGILKGSDYSRFTADVTINPSLLQDHLNLSFNAKYAYSKTNPGGQGAIDNAVRMDPTRPITSADSEFSNWRTARWWQTGLGFWQWVKPTTSYDSTFPYARNDDAPMNPVELIDNYTFYKNANVLMGNLQADYKLHGFEDLRLHVDLSGEYDIGREFTDENPYSTYGFYYGNTGRQKQKKYNLQATGWAQYFKDFNKHHFDIMAGYEYRRTKMWGDKWFKNYYPLTNEGTYDDGTPKAGTINSESSDNWRSQNILQSFIGRANLTLWERYLFTFTARYDGSSRYFDGHRWGFFPAAAFAWRIKDEKFLKNVDAVSDLKLRLGWGKTGQQDIPMDYYTPVYVISTTTDHTYPIGPNKDNDGKLAKPQPFNEELTWETTTTYNVGLDFGMFDQRLTLNVDAYYRKTTDLLFNAQQPGGKNFDNKVWVNAGSLENKGIEIALSGKPIRTKDWNMDIGINAAYNKNKITELYGGRDVLEAGMTVGTDEVITYHKVGQPANSFFVYQQVYDEAGRPIEGCYVDRNGNGEIDEGDRYYYKSIMAPWTGGLSFKISYKNWDLGNNFRASFGNYVYNNLESGRKNSAVLYNNSKNFYENSTLDMVALDWHSYNYSLTDHFVQNASFVKCDNITLGYNFDNFLKFGNYEGISGRIYASCSNVFTITKYKGLDPEQTSGKESSVYPRSRTYLLGINLNF